MTAPAGEQQQENQAERGNAGGQDKGGSGGEGDRTFTQSQLNAIVAQARRETEAKFEGHDELKNKAAQLDQLTQSTKSEVQRATEAAAEVAKERDGFKTTNVELQKQLLRQKISATEKLDPDLWDRVKGDTDEEISADVRALVAKFGTTGGGRPPKGLQSGASAPDVATKKERAAAALRGMTRN